MTATSKAMNKLSLAVAAALVLIVSGAAVAADETVIPKVRRKRTIIPIRSVKNKVDDEIQANHKQTEFGGGLLAFNDEEEAWRELDLFDTRNLESSMSMSLPPPPQSTDDVFKSVDLSILTDYCRHKYGNDALAFRGKVGNYDWNCENGGSILELDISISDVCEFQWDQGHDDVLLGGTANDWACVDWDDAQYTIAPVIVVAGDYVSKPKDVAKSITSVAAAVERVQAWYERKTKSGRTFRAVRPILRLSDKTSGYWNELSCLTGGPSDRPERCVDRESPANRYGYFYEAREEAQATSLGSSPTNVIVPVFVYTGPDSDPFGLGAAAAGPFSVNPPSVAVCPEGSDVCGLYAIGHEMGHSFGLGHSCDIIPEPRCFRGIMQNPGDEHILDAVLFGPERKVLNNSPYFGHHQGSGNKHDGKGKKLGSGNADKIWD